ncbi:hypothetical protein SBA1_90024 [Candidatus Sulfotelmatobacter kueseliae]|uniref:Uncharacterized protein n=1 Tax=Candidatus Sulfotelmatobacter kueseliae TaxID=2042962 RepID=A0A2U3LAG7_9BACT|nr:hypothetical protein SBA1_90024 [Candidatus Sulfotelmatobacter kueseliae]
MRWCGYWFATCAAEAALADCAPRLKADRNLVVAQFELPAILTFLDGVIPSAAAFQAERGISRGASR